jgi:hypothetical protein
LGRVVLQQETDVLGRVVLQQETDVLGRVVLQQETDVLGRRRLQQETDVWVRVVALIDSTAAAVGESALRGLAVRR